MNLILLIFSILMLFYASGSQGMNATDLDFPITYKGCYIRTYKSNYLGHMFRWTDEMTIEMCQYHCIGYKHFGLKLGNICMCGNDGMQLTKTSEKDCNTPCKGNSSQTCGGLSYVNLYKRWDPARHPDYIPPYEYVACYINEYRYIRQRYQYITVLPKQLFNETPKKYMEMSALLCRLICDRYKYFGVQVRKCYCGNTLRKLNTEPTCNTSCIGAKLEKCGWGNHVAVYSKKKYAQENHQLYKNYTTN